MSGAAVSAKITGSETELIPPSSQSSLPLKDLVTMLLEECGKGPSETSNFLLGSSALGKFLPRNDRELVLHLGLKKLVSDTIRGFKQGRADLVSENKMKWKSLLSFLLSQSSNNPTKAARQPALAKACENSILNLKGVYALERVISNLPDPKTITPMRALVRTLINDLEGKLRSKLPEQEQQINFNSSMLEGLGKILANRVCRDSGAALQFIKHELTRTAGIDGSDRETVLFFAVKEIMKREFTSGEEGARTWRALSDLSVELESLEENSIQNPSSVIKKAIQSGLEKLTLNADQIELANKHLSFF